MSPGARTARPGSVYGVATFYSQFRLKPRGQHVVQICNGTACNVKGSESLLEELVAVLGIRPGETTPDAKVTLEQVSCVGACGVAPAIVVDGEVHGRMTPRQTRKLAEKLLANPKKERALVSLPKPAAPVRGKTFLERCCDQCKNREGTPCPNFLLCRLEDMSCHDDAVCGKYRSELRDLARHTGRDTIAQVFLCKGLTCDAGNEPAIYTPFVPSSNGADCWIGWSSWRRVARACAKWGPLSRWSRWRPSIVG
jgi:(2Fe-2S) ferredoxin